MPKAFFYNELLIGLAEIDLLFASESKDHVIVYIIRSVSVVA